MLVTVPSALGEELQLWSLHFVLEENTQILQLTVPTSTLYETEWVLANGPFYQCQCIFSKLFQQKVTYIFSYYAGFSKPTKFF